MAQPILINNPLYVTKQYLDGTLQPFTSFTDLKNFSNVFNGLMAVVNNNGLPVIFQFVDTDHSERSTRWVIKSLPAFPTYGDLTATTSDIRTVFGKNTRAFYIGLEATVQSGDTTGEIEKYIVTEVTEGVPTWTLEINKGTNISIAPAAVAEMLNTHQTGNLVYTTGPIYSYESGDPAEIIYTADQAEAEGQPGYTEYHPALYLISDDSNGDVALSDVVINNSTDGISIKVIGDDIE